MKQLLRDPQPTLLSLVQLRLQHRPEHRPGSCTSAGLHQQWLQCAQRQLRGAGLVWGGDALPHGPVQCGGRAGSGLAAGCSVLPGWAVLMAVPRCARGPPGVLLLSTQKTFSPSQPHGLLLCFVSGGYDGLNILNSVERYDPHTGHWTNVTPMATKRSGKSPQCLEVSLFPAALREQSLLVCSAALEDALAPMGGLALRRDDFTAHWLEFPREILIFMCLLSPSHAKVCIEECGGGVLGFREGEEMLCEFQD